MVRRVIAGQTPKAVAAAFGVCVKTVNKWVTRLRAEGAAGLIDCQSALKFDAGSASNRDPPDRWFRLVPVANRRAPRGAE